MDTNLKVPVPANPSVKPALKHTEASAVAASSSTEKHLTWDEHAIEEHDLLRGTRMKVGIPFIRCCCAELKLLLYCVMSLIDDRIGHECQPALLSFILSLCGQI